MRRVRDWSFSIVTMAAFGAFLVIGDLVQRVAFRLGTTRYERSAGWIQATIIEIFAISGVHVLLEGRDHLADRGGYIFVSNHQSMFDIPIFGGILREHHPRYVAKASLARGIPTVSLYLRRGGNALIDRDDRAQAIRVIEQMGAMCQERDVAAVIFPEGTRSRDGSVGEYRVTGLAALMRSAPDLPIIPTAIDGSWKVFEHNMAPIPYGTPVRIRLGEPIGRTPGENADDVLIRCTTFADETLAEWRKGSEDRD